MADTEILRPEPPKADCTTCRFWLRRPQQNGMVTMCRRFPPMVTIIGMNPQTGPASVTAYPSVAAGDWCGEHKPKFETMQ